jgi:hypothetical protein
LLIAGVLPSVGSFSSPSISDSGME